MMRVPALAIHRDIPASAPVHARACPECNGPVERVPRRFIDRLVHFYSPVHRYHCLAKGWGCSWSGNLR